MATSEEQVDTGQAKQDDFFDQSVKQNGAVSPEAPKENGDVSSQAPTHNGDVTPGAPENGEAHGPELAKDGDGVADGGDAEGTEPGDDGQQTTTGQTDADGEQQKTGDNDARQVNGDAQTDEGKDEPAADEGFQSTSPTPAGSSLDKGGSTEEEQKEEEQKEEEQKEEEQKEEEQKADDQKEEEKGATEEQESEAVPTPQTESTTDEPQAETADSGQEPEVGQGAAETEERRSPSGDEADYDDSFSDDAAPKVVPSSEAAGDDGRSSQTPVSASEEGETGPDPPREASAVSPTPSDSRAEAGSVVGVVAPVEEDDTKKLDDRSSITAEEQGEFNRGEDRKEEKAPEGSEDCRGQGHWKSEEQQAMLVQKSEQEALDDAVQEKDKLYHEYSDAKARLAVMEEEILKRDDKLAVDKELLARRDKELQELRTELEDLKSHSLSEEEVDLRARIAALEEEMRKRDDEVAVEKELVARRDKEMAELRAEIETQKSHSLSEEEDKRARLADMEEKLRRRDDQIAVDKEVLARRDEELEELRVEVESQKSKPLSEEDQDYRARLAVLEEEMRKRGDEMAVDKELLVRRDKELEEVRAELETQKSHSLSEEEDKRARLAAMEEELRQRDAQLAMEKELSARKDLELEEVRTENSKSHIVAGNRIDSKVKDLQERLAILARENEKKDKRITKLEHDLTDVTEKLRDTERRLFASEASNSQHHEAPKSKTCNIM